MHFVRHNISNLVIAAHFFSIISPGNYGKKWFFEWNSFSKLLVVIIRRERLKYLIKLLTPFSFKVLESCSCWREDCRLSASLNESCLKLNLLEKFTSRTRPDPHAHTHSVTHTYTLHHILSNAYSSTCTHPDTHSLICTFTHSHIHAQTYTCTNTYLHSFSFTHIYTHSDIHSHTHIFARTSSHAFIWRQRHSYLRYRSRLSEWMQSRRG